MSGDTYLPWWAGVGLMLLGSLGVGLWWAVVIWACGRDRD